MYDISDIKNYIIYLKKECNLDITLHIIGSDNIILPSELISFNIHDNSYCIYVKTCHNTQQHCIEKQREIIEKCSVDGSFCGICYAGVKEYIYPIKKREKTLGFICVSSYKCENYKEYINSISKKYSMPKKDLLAAYNSLKSNMPPKKYVDTLLIPLCNMLELAYIKTENDGNIDENIVDKTIRFLKQYHTQNISLSDICKAFSCSHSNISHQFKSQTGKSIKGYLTELRLNDAKSLLLHSKLTITEIAFSVGFTDSNYFSNVFKKNIGISPCAYRKTQK